MTTGRLPSGDSELRKMIELLRKLNDKACRPVMGDDGENSRENV